MSKALISTLVAAAFATSAPAGAHTRELLFGPPLDVQPSVSTGVKVRPATTKKSVRHVGKEGQRQVSREKSSKNLITVAKGSDQPAVTPVKTVAPVKPSEPVKPALPSVAARMEGPKAPVQPIQAVANKPVTPVIPPKPVEVAKTISTAASAKPVASSAPMPAVRAPKISEIVAAKPAEVTKAAQLPVPADDAGTYVTSPAQLAKSEIDKPIFETSAPDEHARFQKLQKGLAKGTTIGILPGLSQGRTLSYRNNTNFLPLTNYLSEKAGFLVTPVYETSVKDFRRQVLESRYPMIFIAGSMTDAAIKGGYEPLVANSTSQSAVFVVRANSELKTIANLKAARLAMPTSGVTSTAALGALIRAGVQEAVTVADTYTESRALAELISGHADVAVVSSDYLDEMNEKHKGNFRVLGTVPNSMSYTYWVRKGAYDQATKAKLVSLLTAVSADQGLEAVRAGLKRATKTDTKYVPLTEERVAEIINASNLVNTKWPEFATVDPTVSEDVIAKNKALPVFFPLAHPVSDDALAARERLASKFDRATTLAIAAGATSNNRFSHYQNDLTWLPLANFMSEKAGFLVNPVYGTSVKEFRARVLEGQYPIVYIPNALVDAAVKGGYEPLARSAVGSEANFIVAAGSSIKSLEDLKDARVTFAFADSNATVARGAIVKAGVQEKVQVVDVPNGERAYEDVLAGRADAAVVNASVLVNLDEKAKSAIRVIKTESTPLTETFWVRKGAYDEASKGKITAAILGSTNPGKYVPFTKGSVDDYVALVDLINTKWATLVTQDKPVSAEIVEKNAKSSAFFRIKR